MKVPRSVLVLSLLSFASAAEVVHYQGNHVADLNTPVKTVTYDSEDGHDHAKLTWAPHKIAGKRSHYEQVPGGGHVYSASAVMYQSSDPLPNGLVDNVARRLNFPKETFKAIKDAPKEPIIEEVD